MIYIWFVNIKLLCLNGNANDKNIDAVYKQIATCHFSWVFGWRFSHPCFVLAWHYCSSISRLKYVVPAYASIRSGTYVDRSTSQTYILWNEILTTNRKLTPLIRSTGLWPYGGNTKGGINHKRSFHCWEPIQVQYANWSALLPQHKVNEVGNAQPTASKSACQTYILYEKHWTLNATPFLIVNLRDPIQIWHLFIFSSKNLVLQWKQQWLFEECLPIWMQWDGDCLRTA